MAISSPHPFVRSSLPVPTNTVKSILFGLAAYLLQIAVNRLFDFLAYRKHAFTSYFMFAENAIQRLLFIISRKLNSHARLLLGFTLCWWIASLFDTLLWGLDAPGYTIEKRLVLASTERDQKLSHPASVITYTNEPGNIRDLEDLPGVYGVGLFQPRFNFTLTKCYDRGMRRTVTIPSDQSIDSSGPRIWLDDEGFSISMNDTIVSDKNCQISRDQDEGMWYFWMCKVEAKDTLRHFESSVCTPMIVYDSLSEAQGQQQFLTPNKYNNPWSVLAGGDDTVAMQQVFTVRKGRMRHIFQVQALKIALRGGDKPLDDSEIKKSILQIGQSIPTTLLNPLIDQVITFKNRNESGSLGVMGVYDNYTIYQTKFEYLLINSTVNAQTYLSYSIFRYSTFTITLLRSDELQDNIRGWEGCDKFYQNEATGGIVYKTNCYTSSGNQTNARFLGEVDATATGLLVNTLGVGHYNTTSQALDPIAWEWLTQNSNDTLEYLTARAFIIIDPSLVKIQVSEIMMALSQLQVLLVCLPMVLACAGWLIVQFCAAGSYSDTLFSSLYKSAVAVGRESSDTKPGSLIESYVTDPPEIRILDPRGGTIEINMNGEIFRLVNVGSGGGDK